MPTFIGLIRGINVGGHKKLAMSDLKSICESHGYTNVRTLLNSGNVVFEGKKADAKKLEAALDARVIILTPKELDEAMARSPFDTKGRNLSLLLVMFLESEPAGELDWPGPEEVELRGRYLYLYYPKGAGRSKLTNALIERQLKVAGTARNWNTLTKIAALAHPKG